MTDANRCPICGLERPANAFEGPCPRCLTERDMAGDASGALSDETGERPPAGGPDPTRIDSKATPQPIPPADDATGDFTPVDRTTDAREFTPGPARGTIVAYFGDYELLRELGRGGMGVVYRAIQVSLNRSVALKMIKAGMLAGDVELQRFQNEAEAVALLDHPGIVPVYEIGVHEGQHYFSMKLVEGGNLADQIATMKENPRSAARLLAETAEAVHHAHMRGILHRDLKPANILVDSEGHPHVTDFGLAKRVEGDVEMTQSGAILGTPAYMSPEQAIGRRGSITTASDVYGLGAILYALLTGKAPFGGGSVMDTLDAVRNRPPDSPRKFNASTPRDLETICLKCLEKDPRRRYASAHDLAEDLRNWLDSRPISARRVGATERAWLWCKRKPLVAALAASVLIAIVAGTGAVIAVQTRSNRLLANKNLDLRSANTRLAEQRQRAELNESEAIDAVKKFRDSVANESELKNSEGLARLRRRLLSEPLTFFQSLHDRLQNDRDARPESLARLASASFDLGHLSDEIGNKQDALTAYREALAIRRRMADADPDSVESRIGLGNCHYNIGILLSEIGRTDEAMGEYEAALAIRRNLVKDHPAVRAFRSDLAKSRTYIGNLLRDTGKRDEALASYESARSILQELVDADPTVIGTQNDLAIQQNNIGNLLSESGKTNEAIAAYEASASILRKIADAGRADTRIRNDLARCYYNIGLAKSTAGNLVEAMKANDEALAIRKILAETNPSSIEFQSNLADSYLNIGVIQNHSGDPDKALRSYELALAIQQKLADANPSLTGVQGALTRCHVNIGVILSQVGKPAESLKAYQSALSIQQKLAAANPTVTQLQSELARGHYNCGIRLRALGKPAEALQAYQSARSIQQKLVDAEPTVIILQEDLANTFNNIGVLHGNTGNLAEALSAHRSAMAIRQRMAEANPASFGFKDGLARSLDNIGIVLKASGKPEEALEAHERALEVQQKLVIEHPESPAFANNLGRILSSAGVIDLEANRFEKARVRFRRAVEMQRQALAANPANAIFRRDLTNHLNALIDAEKKAGDPFGLANAESELAKHIALDPANVALDAKLDAIVRGDPNPIANAERLQLAQRAYDRSLWATSARLWGEALASEPKIGDDRQTQYRYNAACSAALASAGKSKDDPKPDDAASAKLRKQALDWLKDELSAWKRVSMIVEPGNKELVAKTLAHWKQDTDLASVRDAAELARLPEAERKDWESLWADAEALLDKVEGK